MKLLAFYNDFIIVDIDGVWYIPNKIIKIEPKSGFLCFQLKDKKGNYSCYNTELQWSKDFDIGFAYIQEAGLLGVI